MTNTLLLIMILLPVCAALCMLAIPALLKNRKLCNGYVTAVTVVTGAIFAVLLGCGKAEVSLFHMTEKMELAFRMDGLGKLFAGITIAMWIASAIFQTEYLKHEKDEVRYHFFFLCSLSTLLGITMSANLITMYVFYELMTLMTFPLVLHSLSKEAIAAAMKYLFYSIAGAFMALLGVFYLNRYVNDFTFVAGGNLNTSLVQGNESLLLVLVFLMILGFGSKAGMFPLHGWLPTAHPVAPAPASALLSGNVTKMGVFAIIRVIYYVIGADFIRNTWVQYAFLSIALLTVVMGSMLAYKEQILKKRLAYSTISQVSYVLFGVALLNKTAMLGALLHVVFHSIVKNTLFMSAGAVIYKTSKTKVLDMVGIGKEMPIVMWCYTIASITLIGIPPTSAFLSKWYLAEGALNSNVGIIRYLGPVLLLVSALLTAGYLLSITIRGFFPGKDYSYDTLKSTEPSRLMTVPLLVLATAAVLFGCFPNALINFITTITATILG